MQIDWLTVGAQWVNFLILMWLLRRYLYQPIVDAMDKRQKAITARTEQAQAKAEQAERLAQDYSDKLAALESQRKELITAARQAADDERIRLLELAHDEIKIMSEQWRLEIERQKNEFQTRLSLALGGLIAAIAAKVVKDLSSLELEQALLANFLERLQSLPSEQKNRLAESGNAKLTLASSFELDDASRVNLSNALNHALATDITLHFEPLADSRYGLRLSNQGYSMEWTVEHYFDDLKAELESLFGQTGQGRAS